MTMTPGARKFALTAHVGSSVGWLGAVAAFLVLSIAGLTSDDAETVRAAYVAMNLVGQFMIVPLSLAALLTGLVQALGTHWGLFRHYWVILKLALTVAATALLLLHQFTAVASAARRVSGQPAGIPDMTRLATQLVVDAGAAVLVLVVTTTLSVYKPWGQIQRRATAELEEPVTTVRRQPLPTGLTIFLAIVGAIVAAIAVMHLAGGGLGRH